MHLAKLYATVAQLVEQLIRNEQVAGSNPVGGSLSSGSLSAVALEGGDSAQWLSKSFLFTFIFNKID